MGQGKKQPRAKRKLIGKIDPETGEIVPTLSRKKKRDHTENGDYQRLYEAALKDISQKEQHIAELKERIKNYETADNVFFQKIEAAMNDRHNELRRQDRHG